MRPGILLVLAAVTSPLGVARGADPEWIWQIGCGDGDFKGLARVPDPAGYEKAFPKDVHFVVGRSDPRKDFIALHPGPADEWAGKRTHDFQVLFEMQTPPAGACDLQIDLADTSRRRPPTLRIRVNGEEERTQEAMLEPGAGEAPPRHPEDGKPRTLHFVLGAGQLKRGTNQIELSNVEGSWLLYHSLALRRLPADAHWPMQVSVRPSIFFVERDGRLKQEFAASLTGLVNSEPVKVEVRSGAEVTDSAVLKNSGAGLVSGIVPIEPAEAPRPLTVTVTAGRQTGACSFTQMPQRRWRVYVVPSVHTDIGYTASPAWVAKLHNRNTDLALELIEEFPLYHYTLEASWAAQMWLRDRPLYRHEALYEAARQGRVGIEAGYANMLTGLCSEEELIRTFYYSARLQREHGVPFKSYTLTDVPSQVGTVPSILAGAGIRYASCGINGIRAPFLRHNIHYQSPFWWEGPDGARVLTWFSAGYAWGERFGLRESGERIHDVLKTDLYAWDHRDDYPYDAILLHGTYSDNAPIDRRIAETVTEYSHRYAYPKVILSDASSFFEYIETHFANQIPTLRGDGGSWWEDGAASSALETATNRNTHQEVIAAETAWAVGVGLQPPSALPRAAFDACWDNILLYDEHTWGSGDSVEDPSSDSVQREWAIKAGHAMDAADQADRLLKQGLERLAGRVRGPDHGLLVFNPSGRTRSGMVSAEIPRHTMVVDDHGAVPQQVVREDVVATVMFIASDVPAAGYRTYRLKPRSDRLPAAPKRFDGKVFENDFYRVTFDPTTGAMSSIIDKTLAKELVDQASPYRFGQLVYASGGGEKENETGMKCPDPKKVTFSSPTRGKLEDGSHGAVFSSVSWTKAKHDRFRLDSETVLYDRERRIDFIFRLNKEMVYRKEALYIAFPFAGAHPKCRYEIGGGSVRPNEDQLSGACRDWFAVQRWLTVNTDQAAVAWVPVDTPLITLCDITPGKWLDELPITNGTLFAYAMNNYWYTNYKAGQEGRFTFRFSLTSDQAIDPAAAASFGESVVQPMRAVLLPPPSDQADLPPSASLCRIEPANVMLTALKHADDGKGLIIRVRETAGRDTDVRISVGFAGVTRAHRCDLVERVREPLHLEAGHILMKLKANAMAAVRIE